MLNLKNNNAKMIKLFEPYYEQIIYFLLIFIVFVIKIYVTEKIKSKVLKKDNRKLTTEKEKIKTTHKLDILKRKYQYESKKEEYKSFFKKIDQLSSELNKYAIKNTILILDEFNKNYLNSQSEDEINNAIIIMSKKMQEIMFKTNKDIIKIKQETNSIRLIASLDIIKELEKMENKYELNINKASKILNELPSYFLLGNQVAITNAQIEIENSGKEILVIRNKIIDLMRKELNEI